MKPYHGMAPYPSQPSLTFLRNDDLNALLDAALERQLSVTPSTPPSISFTHHHDTVMNQIEWDQGQALTIRDKQGRRFPTDILIAADGLHSRVRQQLLPQLLTSASDNNNRRNGPVQAQLIDSLQRQAFQTWAPNRRFAVVPTADGIAWFAAVAQSPWDTSHAGSTRSVQDDPAAHALLVDQFCHPDATATALHDPIAQIIQATDPHLIRYNDAYASPEVHKTLLGVHTLPRSSSSVTDGSTVSSPQQTAAPQRQRQQLQPFVLRVFLTVVPPAQLDPILAQGAGIALEDADHVAQVIAHHVAQHDQERSRGSLTSAPPTLRDVSEELAAQRQRRLLRLHTLSQLAQYLGQHPSPAFHTVRNGALLTLQRVLPTSVAAGIVGRSFDAMIRIADRAETFSIARK
eukprot:gene8152-5870_t